MTRILVILAVVMTFGLAVQAQSILVGAPAADEVTVMRLIPVNYLSLEALTQALGGQVLYLYGGNTQPLGVINDARGAVDTFFPGNRRGGRDNAPAPDFTTQGGAVTPQPLFGDR
jgi:hypothetical protein